MRLQEKDILKIVFSIVFFIFATTVPLVIMVHYPELAENPQTPAYINIAMLVLGSIGLTFVYSFYARRTKVPWAILLPSGEWRTVTWTDFPETSGENTREIVARVLCVELVHNLPQLYVKSRNTSYPFDLWRAQRQKDIEQIPVEGAFHDYFHVYAKRYSAGDALVLLTPDVMEHLIHHAKDFDIEITESGVLRIYWFRTFIDIPPRERMLELATYLAKQIK